MFQFFIEVENITDQGILITDGKDVNHIKNVLRMRPGDQAAFCCQEKEKMYTCCLREVSREEILFDILDIDSTVTELPVEITLFQGLPKSDKMEMIIQKTVELGVSRIVPVASRRAVVRLSGKKEEKKLARWREITKSAAKQSKRGRIPEIGGVMTFAQAVEEGKKLEMLLIPYEETMGMEAARKAVAAAAEKKSLGIYIGPEGGFEKAEVDLAVEAGAVPISLGRRILRTETAGMALLAILGFALEED